MHWINAWWQEVSATVTSGLQITVVGMALVFLTLGLVIVALILLTRLPGLSQAPKKEQAVKTAPPSANPIARTSPGEVPTTAEPAQDQELAQVAAIAVALLRGRSRRILRPRVQSAASRWKQYGRAHQLGL